MKVIFTLLCVSLMMGGCCSARKSGDRSAIGQGIEGIVKEAVGNQMPSPGKATPQPKGIKTTIYIYELTNLRQVEQEGSSPFYRDISTRFVKSVESDENGRFQAELGPGEYSLFTKVDGRYYANSFDSENNIAPVKVEKNKLTEVNILISAKASY